MRSLEELVEIAEVEGELSNRTLVELIVYHRTALQGLPSCDPKDVRAGFVELGLPAPSRVTSYLSEGASKKHSQFLRAGGGGYTMHRNALQRLSKLFDEAPPLRDTRSVFEIISPDDHSGGRAYLRSLIEQINGTYSFGFYDATAVLMRRLMETVLIDALLEAGAESEIVDGNGNYVSLNGLISTAQNPARIRLSRGQGKTMDSVKDVGDAAAHSKTYLTKKSDIDHLQSKYRRLIAELCHLAKIS